MADFNFICDKVSKIKNKYAESDPFKLCKEMDILTLFSPMGTLPSSCKGFYLTQSRIKSITVNSDLSEDFQRIICAHELGHSVLHDEFSGVNGFHDFEFFDANNKLEYEANIFASELLINDEDILNIDTDVSFFQLASELYVPSELLDFKLRILKSKGYDVATSPIHSMGNFLKNI